MPGKPSQFKDVQMDKACINTYSDAEKYAKGKFKSESRIGQYATGVMKKT